MDKNVIKGFNIAVTALLLITLALFAIPKVFAGSSETLISTTTANTGEEIFSGLVEENITILDITSTKAFFKVDYVNTKGYIVGSNLYLEGNYRIKVDEIIQNSDGSYSAVLSLSSFSVWSSGSSGGGHYSSSSSSTNDSSFKVLTITIPQSSIDFSKTNKFEFDVITNFYNSQGNSDLLLVTASLFNKNTGNESNLTYNLSPQGLVNKDNGQYTYKYYLEFNIATIDALRHNGFILNNGNIYNLKIVARSIYNSEDQANRNNADIKFNNGSIGPLPNNVIAKEIYNKGDYVFNNYLEGKLKVNNITSTNASLQIISGETSSKVVKTISINQSLEVDDYLVKLVEVLENNGSYSIQLYLMNNNSNPIPSPGIGRTMFSVFDKETKEILNNAEVKLYSDDTGKLVCLGYTKNGSLMCEHLEAGDYTVSVTASGYISTKKEINNITNHTSGLVKIYLIKKSDPIPSPSIIAQEIYEEGDYAFEKYLGSKAFRIESISLKGIEFREYGYKTVNTNTISKISVGTGFIYYGGQVSFNGYVIKLDEILERSNGELEAQLSLKNQDNPTPIETGDMKITVKDKETKNTLINANIKVYSDNTGKLVCSGITGPGSVVCENLIVGDYTYSATATNYYANKESFEINAGDAGYSTIYLEKKIHITPIPKDTEVEMLFLKPVNGDYERKEANYYVFNKFDKAITFNMAYNADKELPTVAFIISKDFKDRALFYPALNNSVCSNQEDSTDNGPSCTYTYKLDFYKGVYENTNYYLIFAVYDEENYIPYYKAIKLNFKHSPNNLPVIEKLFSSSFDAFTGNLYSNYTISNSSSSSNTSSTQAIDMPNNDPVESSDICGDSSCNYPENQDNCPIDCPLEIEDGESRQVENSIDSTTSRQIENTIVDSTASRQIDLDYILEQENIDKSKIVALETDNSSGSPVYNFTVRSKRSFLGIPLGYKDEKMSINPANYSKAISAEESSHPKASQIATKYLTTNTEQTISKEIPFEDIVNETYDFNSTITDYNATVD
ncbi:MAG: hypothetical protein V1824_00185 [archaeon]